MNYVVFHIPHSSLKIPKMYKKICIKDKDYIGTSKVFMADYLIDKLAPEKSHKLVFKYSRIFCDVERFKDDKKEVMAKKGMGVIYTNDCDNVITIPNNKYKNKVIKSFYEPHHHKLDKIVKTTLNKYGKCTIIDLHSYSDEMVEKLFNSKNNPDICIGVDENYTDKKLIDFTVNHFKINGYSVEINKPYKGTIVPNKYLNKKENRLSSIMIEINKRIYLNSKKDFYKLKKCIEQYYEQISLL